jgi:hypothetical protein
VLLLVAALESEGGDLRRRIICSTLARGNKDACVGALRRRKTGGGVTAGVGDSVALAPPEKLTADTPCWGAKLPSAERER